MKKQKYLFRAKYIDSDQWVYGGGVWMFDEACLMIGEDHNGEIIIKRVKPNTVGQFTNIKDKKGEKIFEKDIANVTLFCSSSSGLEKLYTERGVMEFNIRTAQFAFKCKNSLFSEEPTVKAPEQPGNYYEIEIIGNTIDNAELLKEQQ